jgi:outer membrane protein TolC
MIAGLPFLRRRLLCLGLALSLGCSSSSGPRPEIFAARILPSMETASAAPTRPERNQTTPESVDSDLPVIKGVEIKLTAAPRALIAERQQPTVTVLQARADGSVEGAEQPPAAVTVLEQPNQAPQEGVAAGPPLTLNDAIALAFRLQPQLRASLESIQQARGREDIAFAAFLPTLNSGFSVGGFDVNAGGAGISVPNSPAFSFIPFTGTVPLGLKIQSGYDQAELKLQWLVCDFGRRLGSYHQANIATDIAQLQTERAYQTVANGVATAYYDLLRARSLYRIAKESVRRAEDDLEVAKKLAKGGVIEREKVLRTEVALARAQQTLDGTEEAQAVAVAALNLAIGLNVGAPTDVVDTTDAPPFTLGLVDCLQAAVAGRREFQVARQSVQAAQVGSRVAHADFAPRIKAEGDLLDYQQASPRSHFDLGLGFIKLEWGLFEGGKRVAELRMADSRIREAVAQAESIADTIAYQVTQAYRQMVAARKGIERSRPAVDLARETYRLVVARSREGDAIPTELTDAEAGLTRAELDYANSIYNYLTALERLNYAMGTTPTSQIPGCYP